MVVPMIDALEVGDRAVEFRIFLSRPDQVVEVRVDGGLGVQLQATRDGVDDNGIEALLVALGPLPDRAINRVGNRSNRILRPTVQAMYSFVAGTARPVPADAGVPASLCSLRELSGGEPPVRREHGDIGEGTPDVSGGAGDGGRGGHDLESARFGRGPRTDFSQCSSSLGSSSRRSLRQTRTIRACFGSRR